MNTYWRQKPINIKLKVPKLKKYLVTRENDDIIIEKIIEDRKKGYAKTEEGSLPIGQEGST